MKTLEEKIDEILIEVSQLNHNNSFLKGQSKIGAAYGRGQVRNKLKSLFTDTLKEVVAEVIGEDKYTEITDEDGTVHRIPLTRVNRAKNEQRQRLQAIIKSLEKI